MFRRLRHKKWLVAGLGFAALVAPASAAAGNHNMSAQAYNALVAKGQAMNQRYAIVAQGEEMNERYSGSHGLSYQAYQALVATGQAMNQRYGTPTSSGPIDGRSPDTVDFAVQAHSPVVTVERDPGFQWGDFGIGIAAAIAAVALLGLTRLFSGRGRRQVATN